MDLRGLPETGNIENRRSLLDLLANPPPAKTWPAKDPLDRLPHGWDPYRDYAEGGLLPLLLGLLDLQIPREREARSYAGDSDDIFEAARRGHKIRPGKGGKLDIDR